MDTPHVTPVLDGEKIIRQTRNGNYMVCIVGYEDVDDPYLKPFVSVHHVSENPRDRMTFKNIKDANAFADVQNKIDITF